MYIFFELLKITIGLIWSLVIVGVALVLIFKINDLLETINEWFDSWKEIDE